jgi:hypothetical protein
LRQTAPVLIVTNAGGEVSRKSNDDEHTVMASSSGWRLQELSLLNRVFPIAKGTFALPGPITLGRADSSDISIPEESISKRHLVFELDGGTRVTDCGSTNGTSVDGKPLTPQVAFDLRGGETLTVGNYSFLYHTPASFLAYLRQLGASAR